MKPFAKRLLALASAAAITISIIPVVHGTNSTEQSAPAPTAKIDANWTTVDEAAFSALPRIGAINPLITRQEQCNMLMASYKSLAQTELCQPVQIFTDTDDADVHHAYALGLVLAEGPDIFAPDGGVTRQDFFTSAVRLLGKLGYPHINDITMELDVFEDADQIASYAIQPVQVLLCIGAIEPEGSLEPDHLITVKEAQTLLDRVSAYYSAWTERPVHPQRYPGEDIAEFALNYVGCRYVRGCTGPTKFDCSGLVCYVYKNFGYSLNRCSGDQWPQLGDTIKRADLLPGDVVFFSSNGRSSGIFHVGIYIGDGEFVHAANSRKGVIVSGLDEEWYANRYLGAKRVISD